MSAEYDEEMMRAALEISRAALPGCLPNPPVGCLIVRDGEVLARGYTNPPGRPHAEAMALQALTSPTSAAGTTVYVTLEPCSFDGRTPSCAEALVAAGVRRVFVGITDPHPRNRGRGIAMLRAAGIEVVEGIAASEVDAALAPYLIRE